MFQVLRGPLTVLGRLLLCTIFLLNEDVGSLPEQRAQVAEQHREPPRLLGVVRPRLPISLGVLDWAVRCR